MRFTFLDPTDQTPSFRAKYDAFVFFMLAASQVCSIVFAVLFLWYFLPFIDPVLLGSATVIFLAIAFYIAHMGVQHSQYILFLSLIGIQVLVLTSFPLELYLYSLTLNADGILGIFLLWDLILLAILYFMNTKFPPHRYHKSGRCRK
ncbi:MAG: hypothetical protein ABIH83_05260 [Candidatus Micrarchaeota archaeon]